MKRLILSIMFVGLAISVSGQTVSEQALLKATRNNHIEALKSILAEGVNVDAYVDHKKIEKPPRRAFLATPLAHAIAHGNMAVIKLLLANGAALEAKDTDGWTPLHTAADKGLNEIVELLIEKGADVNAKTNITFPTNEVIYKANAKKKAKEEEAAFTNTFPTRSPKVKEVKEAGHLYILYGLATPLDLATNAKHTETIELLRKHGGKTKRELYGSVEGN